MYDGRKIFRFPFPEFHKSDFSDALTVRNINSKWRGQACPVSAGRFAGGMHELMLVRFKRRKDAGNCNGSSFLCTPMQSQRRNEEEKDNHYPDVREKVQGECSQ